MACEGREARREQAAGACRPSGVPWLEVPRGPSSLVRTSARSALRQEGPPVGHVAKGLGWTFGAGRGRLPRHRFFEEGDCGHEAGGDLDVPTSPPSGNAPPTPPPRA